MSTQIRRKQSFCVIQTQSSKPAAVPCHLHRHPDSDYQRRRQHNHGKMWIGQHRHLMNRQLVRIKQLPRASLSDCEKLASISHDNVIRPESFYYEPENDKFFIVFEYLHLDLLDLFPLYPEEVTCIIKQIVAGLCHLKNLEIVFGIDNIQVNEYGLIKIVLDWNWEFCADGILCDANEGYLVVYLEGVMTTMAQSCLDLPAEAFSFLADGVLPDLDNSYIRDAPGPHVLKRAIQFAIRERLLMSDRR
ncbi:hypothetical protein FPOAC1_003895 [Fusarium poae]|uniref:hypothetical protein n=1 Tax=Fusarium poae TaxID=36050 RepID=UPI001CE9C127|nr:hypothetical protein FPOAC1_003895 [Fusarium poae]KAG8677867.1 hypothetical protein FPOAC1_003895 [Fusarium poae]